MGRVPRNEIEVRRLAAYDRPYAHDRVDIAGGRNAGRHRGELEGARHPRDREILLRDPVTVQAIQGACDQALGDRFVEPARNNGDTKPAAVKPPS